MRLVVAGLGDCDALDGFPCPRLQRRADGVSVCVYEAPKALERGCECCLGHVGPLQAVDVRERPQLPRARPGQGRSRVRRWLRLQHDLLQHARDAPREVLQWVAARKKMGSTLLALLVAPEAGSAVVVGDASGEGGAQAEGLEDEADGGVDAAELDVEREAGSHRMDRSTRGPP